MAAGGAEVKDTEVVPTGALFSITAAREERAEEILAATFESLEPPVGRDGGESVPE